MVLILAQASRNVFFGDIQVRKRGRRIRTSAGRQKSWGVACFTFVKASIIFDVFLNQILMTNKARRLSGVLGDELPYCNVGVLSLNVLIKAQEIVRL